MTKKKAETDEIQESATSEGYLGVATLDNCVVRVSATDDPEIVRVQVWKHARTNPDGLGVPNGSHLMPAELGLDEAIRQAVAHT